MKPRNEQIKAANSLIKGKRKILHADCGFGKTITSLYAGKLLIESGKVNNVLVVSPSNVVDKFKNTAKALGMPEIKTCSWAKIPKSYQNMIKENKGNFALIVDESHKIKNCSKIRTAALVRLAKKAKYLFLLSATPTQHRPSDLYMQLKLCGVHNMSLDNYKIYFSGGFRIPGKTFISESRPTHVQELKVLLSKATVEAFSKRKLKLKHRMFVDRELELSLPKFYETALYRLKAGKHKMVKFVKAQKEGKIEGKGIIFAHHKEVIEYLSQHIKARVIIGGMGPKKKQEEIDKFLKSEEEFIIISITAGGEGIDIPGISKCFFVELTYSPLTDRQAYLRLARDDSDKEIEINYFLLKDEHSYIVQKRKKEYLG